MSLHCICNSQLYQLVRHSMRQKDCIKQKMLLKIRLNVQKNQVQICLRKSAKTFTTVSIQNKTNGPLVRAPHFLNKKGRGGNRNIYKKFYYQRRSVSYRYKSRRFTGKKIQQKGNFLQQKHSSAKRKHSNTPNDAKPISKRKSQQFSSSRRAAIFSKTL